MNQYDESAQATSWSNGVSPKNGTVLITGICGQDAAYLSRRFLRMSWKVIGTHRAGTLPDAWRLRELGVFDDIRTIPLDLGSDSEVFAIIEREKPDAILNLAAKSSVVESFQEPQRTAELDAVGVTRILHAIKTINRGIRFFQASTSELFGGTYDQPLRESTAFHPRSPYACAKLYAHWITLHFREAFGLKAVCGILFNHESPLRARHFVTRKITSTLSEIKAGRETRLLLGNLDARRDWGYAEDYVDGALRLTFQDQLGTALFATEQAHSVREFVTAAARHAGFHLAWAGKGLEEKGIEVVSGKVLVEVEKSFFRPVDAKTSFGDCTVARTHLGWTPKTEFLDLVKMMMEADLRRSAIGKITR
jgi:GDPmannose 4,6-dehydratase